MPDGLQGRLLGPAELRLLHALVGSKLQWVYASRVLVSDGVVAAPAFYLDLPSVSAGTFLELGGAYAETASFLGYSEIHVREKAAADVVPEGRVVLLDNLSAVETPSRSPVGEVRVITDSRAGDEHEPGFESDTWVEIAFADGSSLWFGPAPLGLDGLGLTLREPPAPGGEGVSRRVRARL